MISSEDVEAFKLWLSKNTDMQARAIKDNASRLRRVAGMVDVQDTKSSDEILLKLKRKAEYSSLSVSVRSQLKRAFELYRKHKKLS